jgi:single-stranded-DNA-specific exonuclease
VDEARIPEFAERFNQVVRRSLTADDLVRELRVDLELPVDEATDDLERFVRHMEPFGMGNPGPVFVARSVRVATAATRIGGDGLKFSVESAHGRIEAVGWGVASRVRELGEGAAIDLAYKLERNEFRGRSALQLSVVDFRAPAP